MFKIEEAKVLEGYRLWLRFSNGVNGEVDLSHLAGRGVFAVWNDRHAFETLRIEQGRALVWGDRVDLCADSLYLQLTGKSAEEAFDSSTSSEANA
jgi:hypothetical protein